MKNNITAVFSNGHTDTYKGSREVKAAWMITEKETGKVYKSGHSLDRAKAEKTAAGNIPTPHWGVFSKRNNTVPFLRSMQKRAKDAGFKTIEELLADYKRQNAEVAAKYKIEVIDL